MMLEGQQENGGNVMDNGEADKHGQREQIISMLITGHTYQNALHGGAQHGNPAQRSFTR